MLLSLSGLGPSIKGMKESQKAFIEHPFTCFDLSPRNTQGKLWFQTSGNSPFVSQ